MMEFATKRNSHPMIEYDLLDIGSDTSGFLNKHGHFDRVYSFYCLNWTNQKVAFANIASLLKPSGECLLHYPVRAPFFIFRKEIVQVQRWSKYREVVENAIPKTQYIEDNDALISHGEDLLKVAKLTAYKCVVKPNIVASNQEAMLASVLGTNPVVPLLTAEEKREFPEEMVKVIRSTTMSKKYTEAQLRTFDVYIIHAFKAEP
ncbi:unnamed protein product [Ixodes pacificus]